MRQSPWQGIQAAAVLFCHLASFVLEPLLVPVACTTHKPCDRAHDLHDEISWASTGEDYV